MKRRDVLKNISLFISGTTALSTSSIVLNSCSDSSKEIDWEPRYLNNDEAFLLSEISNVIIPNTEYPGAVSVGVPLEIESYIFNVFEDKDISEFRNDLNKFDNYLNNNPNKFSKSFYKSILSEKNKILISIQEDDKNEFRKFYMKIKSEVVVSYFRSEIGATKVLKYNGPSVILCKYRVCISLDEVGKTWAI